MKPSDFENIVHIVNENGFGGEPSVNLVAQRMAATRLKEVLATAQAKAKAAAESAKHATTYEHCEQVELLLNQAASAFAEAAKILKSDSSQKHHG